MYNSEHLVALTARRPRLAAARFKDQRGSAIRTRGSPNLRSGEGGI